MWHYFVDIQICNYFAAIFARFTSTIHSSIFSISLFGQHLHTTSAAFRAITKSLRKITKKKMQKNHRNIYKYRAEEKIKKTKKKKQKETEVEIKLAQSVGAGLLFGWRCLAAFLALGTWLTLTMMLHMGHRRHGWQADTGRWFPRGERRLVSLGWTGIKTRYDCCISRDSGA